LLQFVDLTVAKIHEVKILKKLALDPGTIIISDRGLIAFASWAQWTQEGIVFVTRMKSNLAYRVVQRNPVIERSHVLKGRFILLVGFYSKKKCPFTLRAVVYRDRRLTKSMNSLPTVLTWQLLRWLLLTKADGRLGPLFKP